MEQHLFKYKVYYTLENKDKTRIVHAYSKDHAIEKTKTDIPKAYNITAKLKRLS